MSNFHRYRAPSWLGASPLVPGTVPTTQPTGKDYIFFNVNDGGDTGSGAARAYGQVLSGPNQYTFMVGLREDATSFAFNRGLKALAENTDYLDDLLNEDRVQPAIHTFVLAAATATIPMPEGAYLGPSGTSLSGSELRKLFRVVLVDGSEVLDATTNNTVWPQSSSVATSPDPPYAGAGETITLNYSLPAGTQWLLYYRKSSLALAGRELLRSPYLTSYMSATGLVKSVIAKIKGDGFDWDGDPPVSLNTLMHRGLNGTYRNSPNIPSPDPILEDYYPLYLDPSTPGNGFFHRDGPSMHGLSRTDLLVDTPLRDPFGAVWSATVADTNLGNGVDPLKFSSGSRGFVFVGRRPRIRIGTAVPFAPALGAFSAYSEHSDNYPVDSSKVRTRVPLPQSCTIQRLSGLDWITLPAGSWFAKSIGGIARTAIVVGWTLIEVEWTNPSDPISSTSPQKRIYRVVAMSSDNQVQVVAQDGTQIGFPAAGTTATITRIFTPWFEVLDGAAELQSVKSNPYAPLMPYGSMVCVALPHLTQETANQVPAAHGAYFGARGTSDADTALVWGGFESNLGAGSDPGRYRRLGFLRGDGSISAVNGVYSGQLTSPLANITTLESSEITASSSITTVDLTSTGVSTLDTVTADDIFSDTINTDVLHVARLSRKAETVAIAGFDLTLSLSSALAGGGIAWVISTSEATIASITFPSFSTNNHFYIVFDHTSGRIQMTDYSSVWPAACVFDDPLDAMLSGVEGAIDLYECLRVGLRVYMKVRRYLP